MKVLWFTNTPSLASDFYNCQYAGNNWVPSLEKAFIKCENIELAIAFITNSKKPQIKINNTTYYPINSSWNKISKYFSNHLFIYKEKSFVKKYLSIINKFNPDIIQVFGTESDFVNICKHTDKPIIIHIQGIISDCYNFHKIKQISKYELLKYSSIHQILLGTSLYHKLIRYKHAAERELKNLTYCKYYFGRTNYDYNFINKYCSQFEYIHCEELLRLAFVKNRWVWPSYTNCVNLISINNGEIYKGIDIILLTANYLKNYGLSFKWYVAGFDKNNSVLKYYENKIGIKHTDVNVILLGKQNDNNLIKHMLASNLYIHTSYIENSSNSICEAMMLGMPVIAINVGGLNSIISNESGIIIETSNEDNLANTIIKYGRDKAFLTDLGNNARIIAINKHNEITILNTILDTYKKIINQ